MGYSESAVRITVKIRVRFRVRIRFGLGSGLGSGLGLDSVRGSTISHKMKYLADLEVPRPLTPRPTYLVVLAGTAKSLGMGAEPAPFTPSEFAVPCREKAAPAPKY